MQRNEKFDGGENRDGKGGRKLALLEGAFTLTEVLVTVVIIGILAALIFPAVGKMRSAGQAAACIGNLRSIGGLIGAYVADHDGLLPSSSTFDSAKPPMDGAPMNYSWDEKLVIDGVMSESDFRLTRSGCPKNREKMTRGCYGYNYEQLGNENRVPPRLVRITAVEQPSKTVMVMDNYAFDDGKGWSNLPYWLGDDPSDPKASGAPVGHGGFVNVLWVDGHVAASTLKNLFDHDPYNGSNNPDRPTPWYFSVYK